jgi:hypothetical protein
VLRENLSFLFQGCCLFLCQLPDRGHLPETGVYSYSDVNIHESFFLSSSSGAVFVYFFRFIFIYLFTWFFINEFIYLFFPAFFGDSYSLASSPTFECWQRGRFGK